MKSVFVVFSVDDPYCGYRIEFICSTEELAKHIVDSHNEVSPDYDYWDYFEQEVVYELR